MKRSPSERTAYAVVQYARHDSGIDHGPLTHRQALDMQNELTKREGSQRPAYVYKIEEYEDKNKEVKEIA